MLLLNLDIHLVSMFYGSNSFKKYNQDNYRLDFWKRCPIHCHITD
jgi:hypothetical protein